MLPLHTAIASARLTSVLSAESQSWGVDSSRLCFFERAIESVELALLSYRYINGERVCIAKLVLSRVSPHLHLLGSSWKSFFAVLNLHTLDNQQNDQPNILLTTATHAEEAAKVTRPMINYALQFPRTAAIYVHDSRNLNEQTQLMSYNFTSSK
ncbi:uncharacterized protein A4U43_C05F18820 [Asparagus officinalis]|uniref:Uncharacterized protein n=1 Tax=Asparagus officinalis TaxID=4686 RepID=A0A5P1ESN3_ASPOF|nr:uncharacterized protein LOC109839913 [Asparagus officinalis]ONK69055.1 uncharacterized protein A4U43_C05F18820 [Asparagus officinalis]